MKYLFFPLVCCLGLLAGCTPAGDDGGETDDNVTVVEPTGIITQVSVVKFEVPGIT